MSKRDEWRRGASPEMKDFDTLFSWMEEHPNGRRLEVRVEGLTFYIQTLHDIRVMTESLQNQGHDPEEPLFFVVYKQELVW